MWSPPKHSFLIAKKKMTYPCQGSDLSSSRRLILKKQYLMSDGKFSFLPKGGKFSRRIPQCRVDRSWCAQRCCDGAATESLLRRSCADQLRRAHSARRVSTRRAE